MHFVIIFMLVVTMLCSTTAYADYDKEEAVKYAEKYATKPNKNYHEFGSDCTNFVSQCLKAGGIQEVGSPGYPLGFRKIYKSYSSWFHKSILNGLFYKTTQGWTTVVGLKTRAMSELLETQVIYVRLSVDEVAKYVHKGDIVQCGYGGEVLVHSIICVGKKANKAGKVFFASHTSNYDHDSLEEIHARMAKKYDGEKITYTIIRPK